MQKVLYMNGGDDETSYAKNSNFQKEILGTAKPVLREALLDLYQAVGFPGKLTVVDLGCSSGPNALTVVADVVDTVGESCRQLGKSAPEYQLFLNDLPGNDFNSVFGSLEAFYEERESGSTETRRCFVAGVPGSFYGRLFPSRSIHFFHSSTSLHWLSQVPAKLQPHEVTPLNKGNIYISAGSAPAVVHAYSTQFRRDFSGFLKCRAAEMVGGGRMVVSLTSRKASDPTRDEAHFYWDVLARLLMDMAEEGCVETEKVDSFNLPFYAPSTAELKRVVQSEGSFSLKRLEIFEVVWEACAGRRCPQKVVGRGERISNCVRAVSESLLKFHFGGDILQDLFSRYNKAIEKFCLESGGKPTLPNVVMSLVRKHN